MTETSETLLPEIFDPATQEGNDLIPIGIYAAQVIEACVAQPQSGDGHYIALTWQITEGQHENRYIWQRITFLHSKEQAVRIGRKQFKDLCVATGISEQVSDVEVFKFIPCEIKVGIETDKRGEYPDKSKVSGIWPLGQAPRPKAMATAEPKTPAPAARMAATSASVTTAAPKPAAASANGATPPPWRKQKPSVAEEIGDKNPY
jgi:hypothetical protein